MEFESTNVEMTLAIGRRLGALVASGTCILVHGPLGAGKTHLARGIAEGARVADLSLVSSPTYVFMNVYLANPADRTSKTVYHLDAYRARGAEDFDAIDLDELLEASPFSVPSEEADAGGVVVIEWPERIADLLPEDRLEVFIEPLDEASRRLELRATGPRSAAVLERYTDAK
jgi:tRNA threonylcarbamoyladenosine biosynthesis protein TsaE